MDWSIEKTNMFIQDYHTIPALWDTTTGEYRNNGIRREKLIMLANKYGCGINDVKKKIKNLRSAFHRERKKLQFNSKRKWFAFEKLRFLLDAEQSDQPRSASSLTISDEDSEDEANQEISQHTQDLEVGESENQQETSKKRRRYSCEEDAKICPLLDTQIHNPLLFDNKKAHDILENTLKRDHCSTYGDYVASELRNLNPRAQTIAKHIINTTLYKAAVGEYDTENFSIDVENALNSDSDDEFNFDSSSDMSSSTFD